MLGVILVGAVTPAFAASSAKANIYEGAIGCGLGGNTPIGFVNFSRTGNTVTSNFHVQKGQPNTTWQVGLWQQIPNDGCSLIGSFVTITINKQGNANGNFSVTVPSASTRFFWAMGQPSGASNETTAVTLT